MGTREKDRDGVQQQQQQPSRDEQVCFSYIFAQKLLSFMDEAESSLFGLAIYRSEQTVTISFS